MEHNYLPPPIKPQCSLHPGVYNTTTRHTAYLPPPPPKMACIQHHSQTHRILNTSLSSENHSAPSIQVYTAPQPDNRIYNYFPHLLKPQWSLHPGVHITTTRHTGENYTSARPTTTVLPPSRTGVYSGIMPLYCTCTCTFTLLIHLHVLRYHGLFSLAQTKAQSVIFSFTEPL